MPNIEPFLFRWGLSSSQPQYEVSLKDIIFLVGVGDIWRVRQEPFVSASDNNISTHHVSLTPNMRAYGVYLPTLNLGEQLNGGAALFT